MASIRSACPSWLDHDRNLREVVEHMTEAQLAIQPGPDRWPLWATIGHLACQRVFWLCDFALEPGADLTPFPDAGFNCPGDDDLEHVWSAGDLAAALDSTFAVVDRCLDTWTPDVLDEVIAHPELGSDRVHSRRFVLQRVFAHDIAHIAELNETLGARGLAQVNLWD